MDLQPVSLVVLAALLLFCSPIDGEVCVGSLPNLQHGVSGQLCIIDSRTLVIREFYYDSRGPDAHLYYYTVGQTVSRFGGGFFIPHPQTGGAFLRDSSNPVVDETLQFTLPDGVFACDIGTFTIWCRAARVFFTRLDIPADTFTTSASEAASDPNKILCREEEEGSGGGTPPPDTRPTTDDFENCKQLHESLSVAWTVNRTAQSVQFMLCGCVGNDQAQDNTWLGFGLSGSAGATLMFGADATIVWVDDETGPQAEDYYLSGYVQCRDGVGACPDTEDSSGMCSNNVALLQGWKENGQQCVIYSRNFTAGDDCDRVLDPDNDQQYIVWGIGGLGETAFRHFIRAQASDPPIHLGRSSSSDCSALQCMSCDPFQNQRIMAPSSTTFVARIGPSGDQRGYMGITGFAGWGIAWFINGTLIPELVVQRGSTYTFIVYGGDDPNDPGNYHPFYITNSSTGGRLLNTQQEREEETVYAGFDGNDNPTGVGPLCSIQSTTTADDLLSDCDATLSQYEAALQSPDPTCGAGATGNAVVWTPDESTSDTVYYQCASHLNLGWKITVRDPVCVGSLPDLQHDVSGQLCIVDNKTLVIRNFHYDSRGPDAYLYYYEPGETADPAGNGYFIPHPATGGAFVQDSSNPVVDETLQFTLPDGVFACDIGTFTIWCRAARVFFTSLDIPADTFTTSASEAASDPSKILCTRGDGGGGTLPPDTHPMTDDFENCKQLHESLSVAWTVNRTAQSVQFMLCGCVGNDQAQDNTWLGFGLSGSESATLMFGADATIVWVDDEMGPQAEDYYLSGYVQCRDGVGACPDTEDSSGVCSNNVALLQGWKENGQQCVIYSRNFTAGDDCDQVLDPDNDQQYIVWGIGGLGETAFRHFIRAQAGDPPIHLGRSSSSDCSALQCMSCDPFQNQRIMAPSSTTFVTRIGPSGDQRGYMGITGFAGWGIAWFINGTLIPELVVKRGSTYTFIVYGGDDPNDPGNYHPFYITNSRTGGRLLNTQEEKNEETVYAGFDDTDSPTGVGPLCSIQSTTAADDLLSDCAATLSQYEAALQSPDPTCGAGATGNVVVWTPDESTSDTVYYQCASHLSLGWRITVEDPDDTPDQNATEPTINTTDSTPSQNATTKPTLDTMTEGSIPALHAPLWLLLCLVSSSLLHALL